jgi:hypothetical protein
MKRLVVIGLAYLLSACQSSLASLPQGHPARVANFPAMASDLSDCVYRAAQSIPSPYVFHRHARADNLEHLVTATEGAYTAMQPELPQLQLRFITQGETTTVEMRDSAIEDPTLRRDTWSIVERCAQQMTQPPGAKSAGP